MQGNFFTSKSYRIAFGEGRFFHRARFQNIKGVKEAGGIRRVVVGTRGRRPKNACFDSLRVRRRFGEMGTFTRCLGAVGATMSKLKTRGAREVFMINRNIVGVTPSMSIQTVDGRVLERSTLIRTRAEVSSF